MTVTEKAKSAAITAAVSTALNYLEKDPEGNIPKVMDLVDRLCPEDWYVPQRRAFREAIAAKTTGISSSCAFMNWILASARRFPKFHYQRQPEGERHAGGEHGQV